MNILHQIQVQEAQEKACSIHTLELIAVDLDISDKSLIQFYCCKCLLDKMINNSVISIEQSKERISQMKTQYSDLKKNDKFSTIKVYYNLQMPIIINQNTRESSKTQVLQESIDDSLEKMQKQIQLYIFPIKKEKQELQDHEQQFNYFEDLKQLSQFNSSQQQKSLELIEDNNFIDQIQRQFELLFNSSKYFQTLNTFKNIKENIKDIMENNVIQLLPLKITKNQYKTPSLSRICAIHKKEIIMIDMDSKSKQIEDRFACINCISENPQVKYQTIENVNKQWKEYNSESIEIISEHYKEISNQKNQLFNQIAQMRKNYNVKQNEISDKLIGEQFLSFNKTKVAKKNQKLSIQALSDEQLSKDLKQLIEKKKHHSVKQLPIQNKRNQISKKILNIIQNLQDNLTNKTSNNLWIFLMTSQVQIYFYFSKLIIIQYINLQQDETCNNQISFINGMQVLVDQAKKYQCQLKIVDQTITCYQQHVQKIECIQQNIQLKLQDEGVKSEQLKIQFQNLSNILNKYVINFNYNSQQLKNYLNIKQLENDLLKQTQINRNLEIDKKLNQCYINVI